MKTRLMIKMFIGLVLYRLALEMLDTSEDALIDYQYFLALAVMPKRFREQCHCLRTAIDPARKDRSRRNRKGDIPLK